MKNTLLILSLFAALVITSFWFATPDLPVLTGEDRSIAQANGTAFSFAALSEGSVHYRVEGPEHAPVVLLIHGFSTPSFVWNDHFAPLTEAGFRVLSFDNYGRGYSDRPDGAYTAERTDQLIRELLDHVGISRPVHLVGYSMGGATAAVFANNHPSKTQSLTLIAPAGTGDTPVLFNLLTLPVIGDGVMGALGPTIIGGASQSAALESTDPDAFLKLFNAQTSFAGYYEALLSTMRHYPLSGAASVFETIGKSALPVQLIWGETDEQVPFALAEPLRALLPQATLHNFPEVSHSITFSRPAEIAALLVTFVEQHRMRQTSGGAGGKARSPDARAEPADCLCHSDDTL